MAGSVWAVLVAAGAGDRLGSAQPKAFVGFGGRPLLAESIERLDRCDWVDAIVVVAPPEWEEPTIGLTEELVASKVSAVVPGGATRAESVRAGLREVPSDALVVLVHDAARPLLDERVIERVLAALVEGCDGVVPGLPLTDTVKRAADGEIVETIDREGLWTVQTPQAFTATALRRAYAGDLMDATDCASLVERSGGHVRVVEGDPRLHKITDRDDLALVESWL